MKRAPDAAYLYCQHPEDTAEHTIFDCAYWDPLRLPVKMLVGTYIRERLENYLAENGITFYQNIVDIYHEECRVANVTIGYQ
ncbi:hypothetical protein QTP88_014064 [Uroleucon formosanum]